jgi:hypothetical protein
MKREKICLLDNTQFFNKIIQLQHKSEVLWNR